MKGWNCPRCKYTNVLSWTVCYSCHREERPELFTAEEIEEALRKSRDRDLFGDSEDEFENYPAR